MLRKNGLEKHVSPVKWGNEAPGFARRHFFDVNGVSIKISWETNVETGEKMWKVLKTKAERKVVPQLAGKILRSTEVKFEGTESKLRLSLKHNVMHAEKNSCE